MTWMDRTSSGQAGGPTPLSESSGMVKLEIGAWVAMYSQTKLPSNKFTRLMLKPQCPRRGVRDPGFPVLRPAARLHGLDIVTLAVGPRSEQNCSTPTWPRQR